MCDDVLKDKRGPSSKDVQRQLEKGAEATLTYPLSIRHPLHSYWRLGSESNRRRRLCRPLHDHSAT